MGKKIGKIAIVVIIVLAIILGILYLIDLNRMENNEPVLFSTWGRKYQEPVKDKNKDNDTTEYSLEQAIKEGCFVITNDNKIYNKDNLDRFIENTNINAKDRKEDNIKIVQYTKEGDPIIKELSYKILDETYEKAGKLENKTTYILKIDNTKDRFASEEDRKLIINNDIPGEFYGIVEQKKGNTVNIDLLLYAIIEYASPEGKQYETINVCNYSSDSEIVENQYFYGTVIESNQNNIIVEPNEDENIRKSYDKIDIGLGEYNDALYEIGTNVKITYDGTIMESYPAQVKAIKIEVKSAENFEILFKAREPIDSYNKVYAILDKSETDKYNYSIYAYDGIVNIRIDGKEYSLKEALLENKITMEEIIAKANNDFPDAVSYDDGGSIEYHYENYTIIKKHTLDGDRDVYIGGPKLNINDVTFGELEK